MLKWVPYHSYCGNCGKAYPWVAADIRRAERAIFEMSEAQSWNEATKTRAIELIHEIVGTTATPSSVVATVGWFEHHDAQSASAVILDAIDRLASAELKTALRAHFPGAF